MADPTPISYSSDPTLYLFTSLTSGSSHVVTATSRLETILKANRIPFKAVDIATDEKARMLWGRRAGKDESGRIRKLPGLVQTGLVVGDLVEIEDWNEYGELKQHVTIVQDTGAPGAAKSTFNTPTGTPSKAPPIAQENKKPAVAATTEPTKAVETTKAAEIPKAAEPPKPPVGGAPTAITLALRQAGQEAAQKAKDNKTRGPTQTFDGVGEAEPAKQQTEKTTSKPPTINLHYATPAVYKHTVDTTTSYQCPITTAWKKAPAGRIPIPSPSVDKFQSLQSPNSTAWKPTNIDPPITMHRGSSISQASTEDIKKIEDEARIEEEDEEDEEDDDDDDEEDEEEDDDEDDEDDVDEDEDEDDEDDEDEDEEDEDEEEEGKAKPVAVKH